MARSIKEKAIDPKSKRTRKLRAKKEAEPAVEKVKEAVKKTVTRKPRKKLLSRTS